MDANLIFHLIYAPIFFQSFNLLRGSCVHEFNLWFWMNLDFNQFGLQCFPDIVRDV